MALRTPNEAVAYAQQHLNTGYSGLCLAHVQDAYGARPVDPSAISAWNNSRYKHPTTDLASAPYGAPIYWSQPGNPYGHIALHLDGDRMYTTDSGAGHPHTASISDWQRRYGYQPLGWTEDIENQPIPGLTKGETMPTAAEIAEYHWTGDPSPRNIYDKLRFLEEGRTWDDKTHASPIGNLVTCQPITYGDGDRKTTASLGDRIGYIDAHTHTVDAQLAQLNTQVAALATAVDTLSKSMGADPEQIAQAVKDAVTAKLDSLQITITATDGDDQ